tara:strand:- start:397 stop:741 length:345 start_codon:yes stop_codon:yes gene_type:complete
VGKTQECENISSDSPFVVTAIISGSGEVDQFGLLLVQFQSILCQAFRKHLHYSESVSLAFKTEQCIVGESHFECFSVQTREDNLIKPFVHNFMEKYVAQQGAYYRPLCKATYYA